MCIRDRHEIRTLHDISSEWVLLQRDRRAAGIGDDDERSVSALGCRRDEDAPAKSRHLCGQARRVGDEHIWKPVRLDVLGGWRQLEKAGASAALPQYIVFD